MTDTFTWRTQSGNTGTETGRVLTAQFGDGYKQQVADGINALVRSWPFSWSGAKADVFAIRDFLRMHIGMSFYWTAPADTQQLYSCATWTIEDKGGNVYGISATFEQAFAP